MQKQDSWLVTGLGNPGDAYAKTRHNAGFMVVDETAAAYSVSISKKKYEALYGSGTIEGERAILVKPMAYMNLSGVPVKRLADYYKIPVSRLLIIHDDIDLSYGRLKIKEKGGHGGHRGVKSIIEAFGNDEFIRLRIGIGRSGTPEMSVSDHVLGSFNTQEFQVLDAIMERARNAVVTILCEGTRKGMNRFNNKRTLVSNQDGG